MENLLSPSELQEALDDEYSKLIAAKHAYFIATARLSGRGFTMTQNQRDILELAELDALKAIRVLRQKRRKNFLNPYGLIDIPTTASPKHAYTMFTKKKADLEYQIMITKQQLDENKQENERLATSGDIVPRYNVEVDLQKKLDQDEDLLELIQSAYGVISLVKPYNPRSWFNWLTLPSFLRRN